MKPTNSFTLKSIQQNGEFLGYCPMKGHVYSVYVGLDAQGNKRYRILALQLGKVEYLIEHVVKNPCM